MCIYIQEIEIRPETLPAGNTGTDQHCAWEETLAASIVQVHSQIPPKRDAREGIALQLATFIDFGRDYYGC